MDRPVTMLSMLMSADGKISNGATDKLDVDRNFSEEMKKQNIKSLY